MGAVQTVRIQVTMRDVTPKVVRVLDIPHSTTLPELHDLLQVALGWTDSHLHQFVAGERRWGVPSEDSWDDDELDEATASLKDLPAEFEYLYDFGDSWEHDVQVLGPGGERPGLVYGEGDCPPEDVGGAPGYEHFLEAMADPTHEEHDQFKAWSKGSFRPFDAPATDALIRRTVGAVPATVRTFLDVIGAGVKQTQAGKLPPAVVTTLVERIPAWQPFYGAMREDNVREVWMLKDFLRDVGVLRVSKGQLLPTKATKDDLELVRRLRRGFPTGTFHNYLVTSGLAVLSASGPMPVDDLIERVLPMMGRGWTVNGEPLDHEALRRQWQQLSGVLTALDLLAEQDLFAPYAAGPSALTLLPRATALADLLA